MQINRYNVGFGFNVQRFLRNRSRSFYSLRPLSSDDLLTPQDRIERARSQRRVLKQVKAIALTVASRIPLVKYLIRPATV